LGYSRGRNINKAYCARVSSPNNQENEQIAGLLKYCIRNKHWSIFEMANMCIEVNTSRDISAQIIRHRSFTVQEFSQRYSKVSGFVDTEIRRQDLKNRQNSFDDYNTCTKISIGAAIEQHQLESFALYEELLKQGVAKECARRVLPMASKTKLYLNGTVRSWIHYLQLRCDVATQKEHRDVALAIKQVFNTQFPIIAECLTE
jgi:thymidylate synthase (FAD)